MNIPKQYLPVMPYIIMEDATGFYTFLKTVFDAKDQLIVPGDNGRAIMHAEVRIGDAVIMFAGSNEQWGSRTCGMFIYVEDVDMVYKKALSNNCKSLVKPVEQEYGYSGGFEDPFGNQWWICSAE